MNIILEEIRERGKDIKVPAIRIGNRTVVVTGRALKIAAVKDEVLVQGGVVPDPVSFLSALKASGLKADIFAFPQKFDDPVPRYGLPYDWDNAAVIDTKSFDEWWKKLPQEARKNARRASKRGVTVQVVTLDDNLLNGIKRLYDESPFRQGRRFWHYGKDLERIRLENSTHLDRSEFIGAYFEGELVGFIKWIYTDNAAILMQILAMNAHYEKRPMNAMIVKAVEVCQQKGASYLVYSKFTFGNKTASPLSDFKRRNGFIKMDYPRYYVPLTLKGRLAVSLGLQRGLLGIFPPRVISLLWKVRAQVNEFIARLRYGRSAGRQSNGNEVKPTTVPET